MPAFLQLAAELRALGAPRRLVGRALQAARDERHHALLCYGMVQRLTGRPVAVGPHPQWTVRPGDRRQRLTRIAGEALHDGIVGEGEAARRAGRRRDAARDEVTARVEQAISAEEARHAALAQDLWLWARQEGGRPAGRGLPSRRSGRGFPLWIRLGS